MHACGRSSDMLQAGNAAIAGAQLRLTCNWLLVSWPAVAASACGLLSCLASACTCEWLLIAWLLKGCLIVATSAGASGLSASG